MLETLRPVLLSMCFVLLVSCGTSYKPGDRARVSMSADYPRGQTLAVLLLPVKVDGKPGVTTDLATTDAFTQRLLELGMRVIDWGQATSRAKELGLMVNQDATEEEVMRIARELGVSAVAKGRSTYGYTPARSESGTKIETLTRREIKNGTHRKDTVTISEEVPTGYSYSFGDSYYPMSQSLTIVSVPNGEVLLSGSVDQDPDYDMTDELAMGIHRALLR